MRTLIAYLAGIATAYALLAIYRTLPAFPDVDEYPTPTLPPRIAQAAREAGRA